MFQHHLPTDDKSTWTSDYTDPLNWCILCCRHRASHRKSLNGRPTDCKTHSWVAGGRELKEAVAVGIVGMGGGAANRLFNTYRFLAALRSLRQKTPDWMRPFAADLKRKHTLRECVFGACVRWVFAWRGCGSGLYRGGICRVRKVQLQRQSRAKLLWLTGSPRVSVRKHCIPALCVSMVRTLHFESAQAIIRVNNVQLI